MRNSQKKLSAAKEKSGEVGQAIEIVETVFGLRLLEQIPKNQLEDFSWSIARLFGVAESRVEKLSRITLLRRAQQHLLKLEQGYREARAVFHAHVRTAMTRLALSEDAADVLLLSAAVSLGGSLQRLCDGLRATNLRIASRHVAHLLRGKPEQYLKLLGNEGQLAELGFLGEENYFDLDDCLRPAAGYAQALYDPLPFAEAILRRSLAPMAVPKRKLDDYRYLGSDITLLYAALNAQDAPAHVLLAGEPGVGKTELARALAAEFGYIGHEVKSDERDCPAGRAQRFRMYLRGCRLLGARRGALVIFDEAEDVFTGEHWDSVATRHDRHKAWTNQLLEGARVPTIWITNSLRRIDPAYLRRFDHVLELRSPPRSVRRALLDKAVQPHELPAPLLERIAESELLSPADMDRVARLLPRAVDAGLPPEEALIKLASGRPGGPRRSELEQRRDDIRLPFRSDWLNVDADLPRLVEGLRRRGAGTLCFSGPPGTGKTELARRIARELDRPLRLKKASDLLSPWLGETEQNIREAFDEARSEGAVLFIDEADSFLQDRALAGRSWEISQVNELLAQLDGYSGVAILATNFMRNLDRAVLRRLDVKLAFGYLRPQAVLEAFDSALVTLGAERCEDAGLRLQLSGMKELSVGDFATAMRRASMEGEAVTPARLQACLAYEVEQRDGPGRKPIGFALSARH